MATNAEQPQPGDPILLFDGSGWGYRWVIR